MGRWVHVYLVPGAVLVSVVMGGGYGTGREVIEYFTRYGALGGLLGAGVALSIFALVLVCTYEFARVFRAYDYRVFFKSLIGRYWIAFEILYALLFLLVLGVISSAAGNILEKEFGIPALVGLGAMLVLVAVLVLFGRDMIERLLTFWCLGMYVVFVAYFITIWNASEVNLLTAAEQGEVTSGWLTGGLLYPLYNLAIAPVLLFSTRAIETRGEAIGSGSIAAAMVMAPALLFHLSYAAGMPGILEQPVPNYWMIDQFGSSLLMIVFIVALFGTLIETGVGLIHGLIERIEAVLRPGEDDALGHAPRALIAITSLSIAAALGSLGIVTLIAKGYSLLAIGFAVVYILPICTIGVVKIARRAGPMQG
jgi:uncharacterized membrane protein YkvI